MEKEVEVVKEIVREVEKPVEVVREVERIVEVEKPVEVVTEVVREVVVEKPVEVIREIEVEKRVEVEVEKVVEVVREVEKPVEVVREVEKVVYRDRPASDAAEQEEKERALHRLQEENAVLLDDNRKLAVDHKKLLIEHERIKTEHQQRARGENVQAHPHLAAQAPATPALGAPQQDAHRAPSGDDIMSKATAEDLKRRLEGAGLGTPRGGRARSQGPAELGVATAPSNTMTFRHEAPQAAGMSPRLGPGAMSAQQQQRVPLMRGAVAGSADHGPVAQQPRAARGMSEPPQHMQHMHHEPAASLMHPREVTEEDMMMRMLQQVTSGTQGETQKET